MNAPAPQPPPDIFRHPAAEQSRVGCAIAMVALSIVGMMVVMMVVGITALVYFEMRQSEERTLAGATFDVVLEVPEVVRVGEVFTVTVRTKNPHRRAVILDSVDVDRALLNGFQLIAIDPTPDESFSYHEDAGDWANAESWAFYDRIPPGKSVDVTIYLRPQQAGLYEGTVYVFNADYDSTDVPCTVTVVEE